MPRASDAAAAPQADAKGEARVLLFTTTSCPKCKVAGSLLDTARVPFERIVADADDAGRELARKFGIRQAPTLVVEQDGQIETYGDIAAIRRYIDAQRAGRQTGRVQGCNAESPLNKRHSMNGSGPDGPLLF